MLKIIKKPKKRPPPLVTFEKPFANQKLGLELVITMSAHGRSVLTAPDCNIAQRIIAVNKKGLVKALFNPTAEIVETAPESFDFDAEDVILCITYVDYLGNDSTTYVEDNDGQVLTTIKRLNGIKD